MMVSPPLGLLLYAQAPKRVYVVFRDQTVSVCVDVGFKGGVGIAPSCGRAPVQITEFEHVIGCGAVGLKTLPAPTAVKVLSFGVVLLLLLQASMTRPVLSEGGKSTR